MYLISWSRSSHLENNVHFVNLPNYLFVKEVILAPGVSSVNFMTFHADLFCLRMSVFKKKNHTTPK